MMTELYQKALRVILVVIAISLGLGEMAHADDKTKKPVQRADRTGFTGGITLSAGGALQRNASRWILRGSVRLGAVIAPQLQLLLDNGFFGNSVTAGPNNARFYTVTHAPLALVEIWDGLFAKGGLGLAYQFERGTQNHTRFGFVAILGVGYRFFERKRFWMSVELDISPIVLDDGANHYLFHLGLGFQFY